MTDLFNLPVPRMPERRTGSRVPFALSAALHLAAAVAVLTIVHRQTVSPSGAANVAVERITVPQLVYLPAWNPASGGGGGGGNRRAGPIRRAEGIGHDHVTVRIRPAGPQPGPAVDAADVEAPPALATLVLDATPLASGDRDVVGLPIGGVSIGDSTGAGSGGGVGEGAGTGIGSGTGPGIGPGSGGGIGGGVYRPGGGVTVPKLLVQVMPTYTSEALYARIEGTVVLEVVVDREGRPGHVRVMRSLDPKGLDEKAIEAVRQWRFEPGRRGSEAVDVLVTVLVAFTIR